ARDRDRVAAAEVDVLEHDVRAGLDADAASARLDPSALDRRPSGRSLAEAAIVLLLEDHVRVAERVSREHGTALGAADLTRAAVDPIAGEPGVAGELDVDVRSSLSGRAQPRAVDPGFVVRKDVDVLAEVVRDLGVDHVVPLDASAEVNALVGVVVDL